MIYITVELNKPVYIKIPKNIAGTPDYKLMMDSQAGGQQFVFQNLNDLGGQSIFKFVLVFETYTPGGTYNYKLYDSLDKVVSKGLIQVNTVGIEDYFYDENELGYFVEDEGGGGDMSNYYTKSQVDSMLTQYEKKSDLPDFNNFVTLDQLSSQSYVTTEEMQTEVESYINSKDLINSTQLANTLEWYVTLNELQGMGYVTASELPTVNDATVTVKQGGNIMGSFTLNQSNNVEILLNEGGQGGEITMNDVKQYVDSQSYVTSDYLASQSYVKPSQLPNFTMFVTKNDLSGWSYVTAGQLNNQSYVKISDLSSYVTYSYLEDRISRIPGGGISMDDVKNYVASQSYVTSNELSNAGYITSDYLTSQSYLKSSDLNNYVSKTELENCAYVTKNALESNYYSKTDINSMGYATVSQIPVVSNACIILRQGGVTKGTFNLNQTTGATIDFDGGSGSGVTMEEVKQYVVSQSYVTSSTLNDYATKAYVQEKINEIPGQDLSAYVTKTDLVNQSYITSSALTDYATKAYVQEKINEIPGQDLSAYVKYTDLNNYGYQTSTQVQNTVNTSINSLNSYTLVFTLADDSTVTVIAYTK